MKDLAFAGLALALMTTSAVASDFEIGGALCFVGPNFCLGLAPGDCFDFVYAPPNVGGNGPETGLTLVSARRSFQGFETGIFSSTNFTLPTGNLVGTTFQTVNLTGISGPQAGTGKLRMRIVNQTPSPIAETTVFVTLIGDIRALDASCTTRFRASGVVTPTAAPAAPQ